mgnify:CR=1 FL=1
MGAKSTVAGFAAKRCGREVAVWIFCAKNRGAGNTYPACQHIARPPPLRTCLSANVTNCQTLSRSEIHRVRSIFGLHPSRYGRMNAIGKRTRSGPLESVRLHWVIPFDKDYTPVFPKALNGCRHVNHANSLPLAALFGCPDKRCKQRMRSVGAGLKLGVVNHRRIEGMPFQFKGFGVAGFGACAHQPEAFLSKR